MNMESWRITSPNVNTRRFPLMTSLKDSCKHLA